LYPSGDPVLMSCSLLSPSRIGPTGQCHRPCVLESTWHGCGRGTWIRIGCQDKVCLCSIN